MKNGISFSINVMRINPRCLCNIDDDGDAEQAAPGRHQYRLLNGDAMSRCCVSSRSTRSMIEVADDNVYHTTPAYSCPHDEHQLFAMVAAEQRRQRRKLSKHAGKKMTTNKYNEHVPVCVSARCEPRIAFGHRLYAIYRRWPSTL